MKRASAYRRSRAAALAVFFFGMAAGLWLIVPQAVYGTFPGRNGLIAVGDEGFRFGCGPFTVHVIQPDGSGLRRLTPSGKCSPRYQYGPDWSADGQRLLFIDGAAGPDGRGGDDISEPITPESLGIMSADGSNAQRVSWPGVEKFIVGGQPSISPDGQRAVFDAWGPVGDADSIWIAALDGSRPHRLRLAGVPAPRGGFDPRWSPEGRAIAYYTDLGGLGVIDAGTERLTLFRRFGRDVESVDWMPDGRRLLLVMQQRKRPWRSSLATVVAADPTSRPVNIALPRRFRAHWDVFRAVSSPDGRRIALIALRPVRNAYQLYRVSLWVLGARGGHLKRLRLAGTTIGDVGPPGSLSWQPIVP
jgi:Tol biopolymer transport system component